MAVHIKSKTGFYIVYNCLAYRIDVVVKEGSGSDLHSLAPHVVERSSMQRLALPCGA